MPMKMPLGEQLIHRWNVFWGRDPTNVYRGYGYAANPDRPRTSRGTDRSIVNAVYNKIAVDVSMLDVKHCRLDKFDRFDSVIDSQLNECLTTSANIDQTGRAFMLNAVMTLLDQGVVALVPVDTDKDPEITDSFVINQLRVGKVLQWYPQEVDVLLYNEITGEKQEIRLPKKLVALPENPFYSIMNESNSTLQRLIRKLNLLDVIDEQSGSGKLDMIIQLPYSIRSDALRDRADSRKAALEDQLKNSKYGIAYADSTEKIIQLNRPVDNNLLSQIEYLTAMTYSQLGMTQGILDGSADENTMMNYNNRIVDTIATVITEEMRRKFLTKTARSQKATIMYFRNPLKSITTSQLADIADKLTRNEITSSNEMRQAIGLTPSKDPKADELRNKNLNAPPDETKPGADVINQIKKEKNQNGKV